MPARIISDYMHVMNLTSFKIEHYQGTRKKRAAVVRYPLGHGVAGQRVLLVDDVCDTGDTFEVANKHLGDRIQPLETRTAVMHYKKKSSYVPDYYARRIFKWRWIIYPWAVAEDISEFIRQMKHRPLTTEEIKVHLAHDYGLRIPQLVLRDILALSPARQTCSPKRHKE
jgi:hypoxanthine phosphoribosyltransferase